jgi:hypothetical protein
MKMIPVWFPWIFIGGLIFILLSFIGAKYKDKQYKRINILQDFISGAILIAFTGVLIPDFFPQMNISSSIPISFNSINNVINDGEIDLQVGPPRLAGR